MSNKWNVSNKWKVGLSLGVAVALIVAVLALVQSGTVYQRMGVTRFDQMHLSGSSGTATPAFMVDQTGTGRILEFRDSSTPVASLDDGGAVSLTGALDVGGNVSSGTGAFTVTDSVNITGAVDCDSTLNVDGASTLNSTLDVDGNVSSGTGAVTVTDNVVVDGLADVVQLLVQGHSTQTSASLTVEDSAGVDIFSVTQAVGAALSGNLLDLIDTFGAMDGTDSVAGVDVDLTGANATGTGNTLTGILLALTTSDPQVTEAALDVSDDDWDYAIEAGDVPIVSTAAAWMEDFFGDTLHSEVVTLTGSDPQVVELGLVSGAQYGEAQCTSGDDPADDGTGCAASGCAAVLGLHWSADQGSLVFETRLNLNGSTADTRICTGLTDLVTLEMPALISGTNVTITPTDALVFCYDTLATTDEWYALGVDGGVAATGNAVTGVAPTQDVYQVLRIEVEDAGDDARFYIDGNLVGTLTANAVDPTTLLTPVVVISTRTTAVKKVDIDYIFVSSQR